MATVRLVNVNKVYDGGVHAVHDFSIDIKDGEFIAFVGPSGCGKSTTLRMIAGLEEISYVEFYIDDVLMNKTAPKDRNIAMVFQSYALYPQKTVYDNMAYALQLRKIPKDEIARRVKEAAEILRLTPYLRRKPRALSGGQRQRVALGRAIVRRPKVFLMDEPLSNLDAKLRVKMRSEIVRIHNDVGTTTIYVTHDQIEAMTMATRIVCMDVGVIKQVGTPEELYYHPKNLFVAGFIGDPPMNFIRGHVSDGTFTSNDGYYTFPLGLSGDSLAKVNNRDIVVAYRPEHAIWHPKAEEKDSLVPMKGKVEVYEMLGDIQNVYLDVGKEKAIIKAAPDESVIIGSEMEYYVKKSDFHLFDAKTEDAIEL